MTRLGLAKRALLASATSGLIGAAIAALPVVATAGAPPITQSAVTIANSVPNEIAAGSDGNIAFAQAIGKAGDFDGDSKADLSLFRPSSGQWYILQSSTNYTTYIVQQWGLSTDICGTG